MDPPSLDAAIQHALAGLYPPFEATAPTILGQVFRLLDSDFRGDGLNFLLDFLIPAKRLCEQVREAACTPYSHHLFLHEGWPLCLRDEVVVHLASLNPLLLRQGDFYLQVEPREEQSVCIMVKCLSVDLHTVDTKPVPESSYPILFTQAWLEAINSDFEGSPLHNCLVASEDGIAPVPWTKITSPEFVDDRPQAVNVLSPAWRSLQLEALDLNSPQELHQARSAGSQVLLAQSLAKGKGRTHGDKYPGLIKVEQAGPGEVGFRMDEVASQDLEGDYVALLDFSQENQGGSPSKEVETSSGFPFGAQEELSGTKEIPFSQRILPLSGANGGPSLEKWTCEKPASSGEKPCVCDLRRKVNHKVPTQDSEHQPQEPYLSVLVNPLHCVSGLGSGVSEEPAPSKTQGPLGDSENIVQFNPGPKQASSAQLRPASPPASPAPATKMEERTQQENGRLPKPVTRPCQNTSPTPGLKFSFLKWQRQGPVTQEKASFQHDGPWKVLCSLYSPKPNRDKCSGKAGTTQTKTSGPDADSDPLTEEKAGFPEASEGPPEKGPTLNEEPPGPEPSFGALSMEIFHSRIACLPGGRDRAGRPLLLVSTTKGPWEAPWCTASEVTKLFSYLCTIPRPEDKTEGLAVVIDARKQPPHPGLVSALQATQTLVPTSIRAVLFLGEQEAALQLEASDIQVEVLTSLKALSRHVDPSQLPMALEGPFPYCHGEWVQFFQKLDPFLADLRQASSLLKASIKEFEKGDPPGGVQEASRCLSKSKELMEAVLRDPGLLGLQREGGATLARLRQEGSRLNFNPDIRSHLAEAAALYSLVDEQLHVLVTVSNHLLRRLELRVRLGRLEAAIHQVSNWMEQEGSQCLQVLTPKDGSLETVEKAHTEFEDFFLQAAMTWFHMDCQDLMAQLRLGKGQRAGPGDQRRLHRYLQRLASEFPAEKLTAMRLQVASLGWEGLGQDLWEEAQERHEEIQTLLKKALAHCPCPAGPPSHLAGLELRGAAAKGQGLNGEVTYKGRWDLPLQDSLGLDRSPKSCWPPWAPRRIQNRNFQAAPPPQEAGQSVEADDGRSPHGPLDPAPERFLTTFLSWQRLPRQSQIPRPTGGSFSSEGTDSQTSLEDSPHTSPPASL
ncbi:uncharacterized protein KIAA1755 homolog isoform X3 [Delphinapterus leucas]|uniref:Uncharacterized protein KIAA1755 homolog isoform X3 n=1 Tax=Delphinapterus leucas TaxID=9749 RepID=A0A2Y9PSB2_DELLE|nr:uncharacterized protein KIAA1755 homolog isoform X3 [Delphinapterus leucas]